MAQCKICALEEKKKAEVEKRISTGRSYAVIATELKDLDIHGITSTLIMRHKANHMESSGGEPSDTATPTGVPALLDTIDVEKQAEALSKSLLNRDYQKEAIHQRMKTHVLLEEIAQKQMFIVNDCLSKYINGIGHYPNDQIRGMKITLDLIERLPTYSDKTLLYKINQLSENARKP